MKQVMEVVIEIEAKNTHSVTNIEQALNFFWGSNGTFKVTRIIPPNETQWIGVDECLPSNGRHYLVAWREKTSTKAVGKKHFVFVSLRSYNKWEIEKKFPWRIVTHWMPLPDPPSELTTKEK